MKLESTKYNHGQREEIIMTCTVNHEVAFKAEDIVNMLKNLASDDMAKVINIIGKEFNNYEMTESYAADDLDQEGRDFIEKMHYFINWEENESC